MKSMSSQQIGTAEYLFKLLVSLSPTSFPPRGKSLWWGNYLTCSCPATSPSPCLAHGSHMVLKAPVHSLH